MTHHAALKQYSYNSDGSSFPLTGSIKNVKESFDIDPDEAFVVSISDYEMLNGLEILKAKYMAYVLEKCRWNQVKAASRLGISRGCLRVTLKAHYGDKYIGFRGSK
jgi:DNA-binding protein Fis